MISILRILTSSVLKGKPAAVRTIFTTNGGDHKTTSLSVLHPHSFYLTIWYDFSFPFAVRLYYKTQTGAYQNCIYLLPLQESDGSFHTVRQVTFQPFCTADSSDSIRDKQFLSFDWDLKPLFSIKPFILRARYPSICTVLLVSSSISSASLGF